MLVADVLGYWYKIEIPKTPRRIHGVILTVADMFSMPLLIRTLFAPWRRDVVSMSGVPLQERFRVLVFNLVSVFVGFFVRVFVLIGGALTVGFVLLFGFILLIIYAVLPALPIVFLLMGIVYLFR